MTASYICLNCRRRLLVSIAQTQKPQWLRRASTLTSAPSSLQDGLDDNSTTGARLPLDDSEKVLHTIHSAESVLNTKSDAVMGVLARLNREPKQGTPGRYSSFFPESGLLKKAISPIRPNQKSARMVSEAAGMDKYLDNYKVPAAKLWSLFKSRYPTPDCPALKNQSFADLVRLGRDDVFGKLLSRMVIAWCQASPQAPLPKPLEVIAYLEHIRTMRGELWSRAIWIILGRLLKTTPKNPQEDRLDRTQLLQELMRLWQSCLSRFSKAENAATEQNARLNSSSNQWFFLPNWETLISVTGPDAGLDYRRRFYHFLPSFPVSSEQLWKLSTAALVTFDILVRDYNVLESKEQQFAQYQPFVTYVAQLMHGPRLTTEILLARQTLEVQKLPSETVDAMIQRLEDGHTLCNDIIGLVAKDHNYQAVSTLTPESRLERLVLYMKKRVARATERQNIRVVTELWDEARTTFSSSEDGRSKAAIPLDVYNSFLFAFNALRKPEPAVRIWNSMVADGVRPTVVSWTAMMRGCLQAGDADTVEKLWQKMLASGVQPNELAWCVRIRTLLSFGRPADGLRALDEMTRIWIQANNSDGINSRRKKSDRAGAVAKLDDITKPSVTILNSALTGLARSGQKAMLGNLLKWARTYDIKLDCKSYNIIIEMALKANDMQEASKVLLQMEKAKIEPDVVTFSLLVETMFRNAALSQVPAEELPKQILTLLHDMESRGIEINSYIYTEIIGGLINRLGNMDAVQTVLMFMKERNTPPSPKVLSVLLSYHVNQEVPDMRTIDVLWEQISANKIIDFFLYDRLIQVYARFRDIGKTMMLLARMAREGKPPSFYSLEAVLEALAATGQWARFHELLADVKDGDGFARDGIRGWAHKGNRRFWETVDRLKRLEPPSAAYDNGRDATDTVHAEDMPPKKDPEVATSVAA